MYDFDKSTDRKKTNAFKWKALKNLYGDEELYPMWVADMEFETAPAVKRRILERAEQGIFGYELLSDKYGKAVKHWLGKRHGYQIDEGWVVYCSSVMTGLSAALQALTKEGDEILINPPIYGNFFQTIQGCGRKTLEIPLVEKAGKMTFDMERMERAVSDRTKASLLCSPHNPTGRVWTKKELGEIIDFCRRHHLLLFSDEVHFDLVFEGEHCMTACQNRREDVKVITFVSPGKSFNVAGMQTASMIIEDPCIRSDVQKKMKAMSYPFEHSFAEAVTVGAYLESEQWLNELLDYLGENRRIFTDFISANIPVLRVVPSEATYLMWVDCHSMDLDDEELEKFWIQRCHLALSDGREFGTGGSQYVRFNVACQRESLKKVLEQMAMVFHESGFGEEV